MCDQNILNGLISIVFTSLAALRLTSNINRVHPLVVVNIFARFDKDSCNSLVNLDGVHKCNYHIH